MNEAEHWQAVKELFERAVELEGDARVTHLAAVRTTLPTIAADVESLLEWDARGDGPLDAGLPSVALPGVAALDEALVGTALGPWRVVGVIGGGGMGVVYRAERADAAFTMPAAIKVVRRSADRSRILQRFLRERETLAALDHPNIARILDGGTTPQGQPYLVMEFVDGVPIDRYCDERKLGIDARLDLFRPVCGAVHYAHQTLVVHRDIKPDNILVTNDGVPKLLDFGVAKLLSHEEPAGSADELAPTWLLTPEYASPEQLRGRQITTTTDVYSLGVLLHVLLTGQRPYVLSGRTPGAWQAQLDDLSLRGPSELVTAGDQAGARAERRGTTPARLARRLAGDLDAIVLKALEPGAARRYGSVDQLANDLERHRTLWPIEARSGDLPYVLRRLARRYRTALFAAATVALLLVVAMGAVIWQARVAADARARAERRFADVRRLAQSFIFDVHDAIVNVPGTTEARGLMVRTAVSYLDSLASEAAGDRALQRELAAAYVKVGDAQGHPTSANLGDTAGARASYLRAIAIAGALGDDADAGATLARAHRQLGDVLAWSGDTKAALLHAEQSQRQYAAIAGRRRATVEDRLQAAIGQIKLGDLLGNPNFPNAGRADEALRRYDTALSALRGLESASPQHERVRRYLGLTLERIGTMAEAREDWVAAEQAYRESFTIRAALASRVKHHTDIQRDFAVAFEKLGNVQRARGTSAAALESYRGALAQFERLAAADPRNAIAARSVAISKEKVAGLLVSTDDPREATRLLGSALATYRTLADSDPDNMQTRCDRRRAAQWLGDVLAATSARADACTLWRESADVEHTLRQRGATGCLKSEDADRLQTALQTCPRMKQR